VRHRCHPVLRRPSVSSFIYVRSDNYIAKPREGAPSTGKMERKGQSGQYANRITFYDGYLDTADRKWIEDNFQHAASGIFELVEFSQEYGGLSCKFDARSGQYLAILFGGDTPDTGQGYALTSRASTPTLALYVLYYKALHKFTGAWYATSANKSTLDFS